MIKPEYIFGIKSLNYIVRKDFLKVIACNVDSKLVVKLENSLWD